MRILAAIVFLVAAAGGVTLRNSEEAFDFLLTVINCNSKTKTGAELLSAYNKCNEYADMKDITCLFPCIANELGLLVGGKLIGDAVSNFVLSQFKNLDPDKRKNWTEGIKTCFNHYESRGEKFPTDYKDCYQETDGLLKLSTCILLTRDCEGNLDKHKNAMLVKKRNKRQLGGIPRVGVMALGRLPAEHSSGIFGKIVAGMLSLIPVVGFSAVAIVNSQRCGKFGGCYKGYCFSYCGLSNKGGDWCYTTKTFSQSFEYVKCNSTKQCDNCWKCAGSCTYGR